MNFLNKQEIDTLKECFEAFVPFLAGPASHSHQGLNSFSGQEEFKEEWMEGFIEKQSPAKIRAFKQLLKLLNSPVFCLLMAGKFQRFSKLNLKNRHILLQRLRDSRLDKMRQAYTSLKSLVLFVVYSQPGKQEAVSAWEHFNYRIPSNQKAKEDEKEPLRFAQVEERMVTDVLVIGSGAGGALAARELAKRGKKVLIIDKGPALQKSDFNGREGDMVSQLYERGGALTNETGSMTLFAGSCLGGGTTVNWAGCFKTPRDILEEWAEKSRIPSFTNGEFEACQKKVWEDLDPKPSTAKHNGQNQALWTGSEKLGYNPEEIDRNEGLQSEADWEGIGFSCFGDRSAKKKGGLEKYLPEACQAGASILANAELLRLEHKEGKVDYAAVSYTGPEGTQKIRIFAKEYLLAAGAIHSPAILMRSGIEAPELGKNLYLHPTVGVSAIYDQAIHSWQGPMMSVVNNHFTHLEGLYGFKLETPPVHPGLFAMTLPWEDGHLHKEYMQKMESVGNFIVLVRDKTGGKISIDAFRHEQIHYWPEKEEMEWLKAGMLKSAEIHFAAGAHTVLLPNQRLRPVKNMEEAQQFVEEKSWKPNTFPLFSAHQMGTCRMSGNKENGVVDPAGKVWGFDNLRICDASIFPASSGVNPMITVMSLAQWVVDQME